LRRYNAEFEARATRAALDTVTSEGGEGSAQRGEGGGEEQLKLALAVLQPLAEAG